MKNIRNKTVKLITNIGSIVIYNIPYSTRRDWIEMVGANLLEKYKNVNNSTIIDYFVLNEGEISEYNLDIKISFKNLTSISFAEIDWKKINDIENITK